MSNANILFQEALKKELDRVYYEEFLQKNNAVDDYYDYYEDYSDRDSDYYYYDYYYWCSKKPAISRYLWNPWPQKI